MVYRKGQLNALTHDEILEIGDNAFKKVRVYELPDGYETDAEIVYAQDIKRYAKKLPMAQKEKVEYSVNGAVLEEVDRLVEYLVDKLKESNARETKDIRSEVVKVLEYQDALEEELNVSTKEKYKLSSSQGYTIFSDFTDEELEYFWNGKNYGDDRE